MDADRFVEEILGLRWEPNSRGSAFLHQFGKVYGHIAVILNYETRIAQAWGRLDISDRPNDADPVFLLEERSLGEDDDNEREWHVWNSMQEAYGGHEVRTFITWERAIQGAAQAVA